MDARTLLKTPRDVEVNTLKGGGKYCHLGIEDGLKNMPNYDLGSISELKMQINIDGLPISKSSGSQVWPILIGLADFHEIRPFVAGIYHGDEKPKSATEFLQPLVSEIAELMEVGVTIEEKQF